jgi:hypothetical protein
VTGKTNLEVEGNVLGYNLYLIKPTNKLFYPAVVKVKNVIQGTEKSEYIYVLLYSLDKDYAEENFGANKISTFKLERQKFCDIKIKNLLYAGQTIENGKIVETSQTFTLVLGVESKSLPLKKIIPCYIVSSASD